jgi:defect-in-organelle-trafficking protein DotD
MNKEILKSKMTFRILPFLTAPLLVLTSCAYMPIAQPQMVAEPDTADLMLADAADRATRALETLSAMERTQLPAASQAAIVPNAPQELRRAVTFDWVGPVEPLVEELTRKSGYRYNVIGKEPATPIIVTMSAINKPLINVFRDVGIQLGARADIKVDASTRMVELQYNDFANNRNDQ